MMELVFFVTALALAGAAPTLPPTTPFVPDMNLIGYDYTVAQSLALDQANVITSVVSMAGSLFIVFCYIYLKELRTFAFKLVLMMSLSDIMFSVGNFLGDAGGDSKISGSANASLCQFQAILISYFGLTSLFWAFSIAFTLHKAFLQESEAFGPTQIHEHTMKYHAVCWIIPAVLTGLPLITSSYGDTGGWCWITTQYTYWRFLQFYIWLWLGIAYNCYVFINIYQKIKVMSGGQINSNHSSAAMANRLRMYPVVLIVCHIFGTINAIYEAAHGGKVQFELSMLTVIFGTSMGLFNALVYGLTPEIKSQLCSGNSNQMEALDDASI